VSIEKISFLRVEDLLDGELREKLSDGKKGERVGRDAVFKVKRDEKRRKKKEEEKEYRISPVVQVPKTPALEREGEPANSKQNWLAKSITIHHRESNRKGEGGTQLVSSQSAGEQGRKGSRHWFKKRPYTRTKDTKNRTAGPGRGGHGDPSIVTKKAKTQSPTTPSPPRRPATITRKKPKRYREEKLLHNPRRNLRAA